MEEEYVIGLDLGINNVGWAIVNSKRKEIEKCGVRLFRESNDASQRRITRNARRRLKRKNTRVRDVLVEFQKINFPSQNMIDVKLIEKRYLGIGKKIEKQDIVNIVCFLVSHRGYIPFGDEEVNFIDLNGKLPCEYYYDLYLKIGKYRALDCTVKNCEIEKEVLSLFQTQVQFYPELGEIQDKVLEIFRRKRKFWEGPGSVDSLTPYGRFQTPEQVSEYLSHREKNPNYEKYLFEDLIGNCEIIIGEKCAPKLNFYAEKFNLLNDFINTSIIRTDSLISQNSVYFDDYSKKYKFTKESLDLIFQYCISNDKVIVKNMLKSLFGLKMEDIDGYRVDKKRNPEFATMNYYRYISKIWKEQELDDSWIVNEEAYNRVIYYLTVAPGITEILKMIEFDEKIDYEFSDQAKVAFQEIYGKLKKDGVLKYHSLSEKILKRAIQDMIRCQMNFMQVRRKFDYDKEAREYFSKNYSNSKEGMPHMNSKFVDSIVASPQVKKTLRQAIRVINAIIDEKKRLPKVISIESTKEMNGKEARITIERAQRKREKLRKQATEEIASLYGDLYATETNKEKVMLYYEIHGQCPYCNRPIGLNDVIDGRIQVEHILPLRESFNDSYDNKTIACVNCNQEKAKRTPYQYLFPLGSYESYKKRIQSLKNISEEKMNNFLYEEDLNKYTTRFFNRNLRDTAYATKELIRQVQLFNNYLKLNYEDTKILTLSTPGQLTHRVRRTQNLTKDRDAGRYHHAVDAGIVGAIATTSFGEFLVDSQNNPSFFRNHKDQQLLEKSEYIYHFHLTEYKNQLQDIDSDEKINISSQIQKNPQKQLANANIYKIFEKDGDYYRIDQIDNIYLVDFSNIGNVNLFDKLFNVDDPTLTLLCQDNDQNLFHYLKEIYLTRQGKENPFVMYCKERYGLEFEEKGLDYLKHGIRVPSKKNKGPVIVRLRYYQRITTPYLVNKSSIVKNEKTLLAFDSMAQYCTKVFVDLDSNKFVFLPIYSISMDLEHKIIKENDSFYQTLYQKYIGERRVQFISNLYNGNLIEIVKKNGSIIMDEYQGFHKNNGAIRLRNGGYFTVSDLEFSIYDVDVLGNRRKRLTYRVK